MCYAECALQLQAGLMSQQAGRVAALRQPAVASRHGVVCCRRARTGLRCHRRTSAGRGGAELAGLRGTEAVCGSGAGGDDGQGARRRAREAHSDLEQLRNP